MTGDARTGAALFVETLERYGVGYLFGNPGTTELPVMQALEGRSIEYVLGLHEDVAVGAAAGFASTQRYHGTDDVPPVGVVNLHVAPGLAHGLGNLYGAKVAGAPLVVTAGNHSTDFRHEEPILSGDLVGMADRFCKWSAEVLDAETLPTMLRRAFRVALTPPTGPVFLALPLDVMRAETTARPEPLGPIPDAGRGDPDAVEAAASLLAAAEDPVLVVGDHVARSGRAAIDAAVDLAEATGARVVGEILSAEVNFPGDHEQWAGFTPSNEAGAREAMAGDVVAFVGCSTHTTPVKHEGPLVDPDTDLVHVGPDPWQLGKNEPTAAAVVGDPGHVLSAMASAVRDRTEASTAGDGLASGDATSDPAAPEADDGRPSKAQLVDALRAVAPDAFLVDEGITSKYVLLDRWPLSPEQFLSNKGGGLGYGLPAAVGAALAEGLRDEPRTVVGFVGDGSYLYYPHAVYTAVRLGLDLTVVVSDNRNYRILKDNMLSLVGGTEEEHEFVGVDFDPAVDIPTVSTGQGARSHRVDAVADLESTLADAIDHEGVDVVDVHVHD